MTGGSPGGRSGPRGGPPAGATARLVADLELRVRHRLWGLLQGDYAGLLPGPGAEPGEARPYVPGDDVRRIDWNLSARTGRTHVRDTIADRELEVWVVCDLSPSMAFGTARLTKADVVAGVAAAVGVPATRLGNRLGAVICDGPAPVVVPARGGRTHLEVVLATLVRRHPGRMDRPGAPGALVAGLEGARRVARRRGLMVVVSDLLDDGWQRPLRRLAADRDVIVVEVVDPREDELVDVGTVAFVDPETGRHRWVDTGDRRLCRTFGEAARRRRREHRAACLGAGADHVVLRTDRDWLVDLVRFLRHRRSTTAVPGPARAGVPG